MKQTEQMQKEKFFVYIHIKTLFINVKKICKMCQIRKKFSNKVCFIYNFFYQNLKN